MASRAVTQLYDNVLRPSGLWVTQFSILAMIARLGEAKPEATRGHARGRPDDPDAEPQPPGTRWGAVVRWMVSGASAPSRREGTDRPRASPDRALRSASIQSASMPTRSATSSGRQPYRSMGIPASGALRRGPCWPHTTVPCATRTPPGPSFRARRQDCASPGGLGASSLAWGPLGQSRPPSKMRSM